jgi:hypothetical protein
VSAVLGKQQDPRNQRKSDQRHPGRRDEKATVLAVAALVVQRD